jgi:DNA replication protein DnaC
MTNQVIDQGILILGPPGTGKSTICLYLYKKLKEDHIPFLICPIASLQPDNQEIFLDYVHELKPGKIVLSLCTYVLLAY